MAIAFERAVASPRPWLTATRVLLLVTTELFVHGIAGRGRPARIVRATGRVIRE
ncbi:MAG: hypothetical protein ABI577_15440 [bacterium]